MANTWRASPLSSSKVYSRASCACAAANSPACAGETWIPISSFVERLPAQGEQGSASARLLLV